MENELTAIIQNDCKNNLFKPADRRLPRAGAEQNYRQNRLFNPPEHPAYVINAADYGVAAGTGADMSKQIQAAVKAAHQLGTGQKLLCFPAGEICADALESDMDYLIDLNGIEDLYVDFGDATFLLAPALRAVRVRNCRNVTLADGKIDRSELPYFMGVIEEMDAESRTAVVTVNDGYPLEDNFPCREYLEFIPDNKEPRLHGNFLYNNSGPDGTVTDIKSFRLSEGRKARIEFGCPIDPAPKGIGFVMSKTMYGVDTVCIEESSDIRCENISVYCTAGMGIRGNSCDNLYFNRTNICLKPDSDRYMTVTADGMHFIDCKGDLQITNSLLENSHDDSINIHGMFQMVVDTAPEKNAARFYCARAVRSGCFDRKHPIPNPLTLPFRVGDQIELSKDKTLEFKQALTVKEVWWDDNYCFWAVFEEPAMAEKGDIASNITRTPAVLIKNCVFRNKRNRGILLQTRNSIVEDCTFYNVIMTGICLFCDCLDWYESLNPRGIRIRRNKFIGSNVKPNNFGAFAPADIDICVYGQGGYGKAGLVSDIEITENIFVDSGTANVSIQSASDILLSGNYFIRPCRESKAASGNCAVLIGRAEHVRYVDNYAVSDDAAFLPVLHRQEGEKDLTGCHS